MIKVVNEFVSNARLLTVVNEFGNVTEVNPEYENAIEPIVVTPSGITTLVLAPAYETIVVVSDAFL